MLQYSINLKLLSRLWCQIDTRRRRHFGLLLALTLVCSLAEMVSISAVVPFLAVLTAPSVLFEHSAVQPLIRVFEFREPKELLLPLTIAFALAALIAGVLRSLMLWASTRLSYATGADLGLGMYIRSLHQPYTEHISRNSSELINGILVKTNIVINIVLSILTIISSFFILVCVLFALSYVDATISWTAFIGFGFIYILISKYIKNRLMVDGQIYARESNHIIKALQEGFGGIRDILLGNFQTTFSHIYRNTDQKLRRAQGNIVILSASPRFAIEALGMVLIAILAYSLAIGSSGISGAIPVLGGLALGAQRLLPVLQQTFAAWSYIQGGQMSLRDALELLEQPLPHYANQPTARPLPFKNHIRLKGVSFRYSPHSPWIFKNLELSIIKGRRIGFIGPTGSGKSTLLDIIMGLLSPTEGTIEVDGQPIAEGTVRLWQSAIAHVPQVIFLADGTIEENIAFGIPKNQIDRTNVRKSARLAQISETIDSWPKQYQTVVGERGVKLSGGQRQRIGIARALYRNAKVIILDEATSALDNSTEKSVMEAIDALGSDITILTITHRLTTLKNCSQIFMFDNQGKFRATTYSEMTALGNLIPVDAVDITKK